MYTCLGCISGCLSIVWWWWFAFMTYQNWHKQKHTIKGDNSLKQNRCKNRTHTNCDVLYGTRVDSFSLSLRRVKYWSSRHDTIGIYVLIVDSRIKFTIFVCCIKRFFVAVINQSTCSRHQDVVVVKFPFERIMPFFSGACSYPFKCVESI